MPILFAYTPLLSGDWPAMIRIFLFGVVGIYGLSAALQGCMERPFGLVMRLACAVAGLATLWPGMLVLNIVGALAVLALLAWNVRTLRTLGPVPA